MANNFWLENILEGMKCTPQEQKEYDDKEEQLNDILAMRMKKQKETLE